jgi:hypothetical protein
MYGEGGECEPTMLTVSSCMSTSEFSGNSGSDMTEAGDALVDVSSVKGAVDSGVYSVLADEGSEGRRNGRVWERENAGRISRAVVVALVKLDQFESAILISKGVVNVLLAVRVSFRRRF